MSGLRYQDGPNEPSSRNNSNEAYEVSVEKLQSTNETKEEHNKRVIEFTQNSLHIMKDGDILTVKSKRGDKCQSIKLTKGYTRIESKKTIPRWNFYNLISVVGWGFGLYIIANYTMKYGSLYLKKT